MIAGILLGLASASSAETVILCLGDSLTEGYGIAAEEAWPAVLETRLREQGQAVRLVNAGVSGSTSASAVSRLRWHLKSRPRIVILALGANDGLRGVSPAETQKNLSETIALARENGAKVLLAGMKMPPNYGLRYPRQFEAIFPALARQHQVPRVPFLLAGVAGDPAMNLADGIHPNPAGHRRMAETILPHLLPLL